MDNNHICPKRPLEDKDRGHIWLLDERRSTAGQVTGRCSLCDIAYPPQQPIDESRPLVAHQDLPNKVRNGTPASIATPANPLPPPADPDIFSEYRAFPRHAGARHKWLRDHEGAVKKLLSTSTGAKAQALLAISRATISKLKLRHGIPVRGYRRKIPRPTVKEITAVLGEPPPPPV